MFEIFLVDARFVIAEWGWIKTEIQDINGSMDWNERFFEERNLCIHLEK